MVDRPEGSVDTPDSCDIADYKLPIVNTDKQRRNFSGFKGSKSYVNLAELQKGWESGNTGTKAPGRIQTDEGDD